MGFTTINIESFLPISMLGLHAKSCCISVHEHLALNLLFRNMRFYKIGEKGGIIPRKGIVGDLKNHFSPEDLDFTESVLAKYQLSLSEWDS